MKDRDKMILIIGWSILLIGIIALIIEVAYKTDLLNRRLDDVYGQIEYNVSFKTEETPVSNVATPTDLEEASIELRECFCTPSEPQEDTEEAEVAREGVKKEEATEEPSESSVEPKGELVYAGIFELTAYCWTGNPCANGNYPVSGYTVASNFFPLGTKLYIEGMGEYVVEDRGGMADNVVDIYMDGYETCINFGRKQAGVYIIEDYN